MDERAAPAPTGGEAFGQHARDRVEIRAGQGAERPGAAQPIIKLRLRPILRCDFRDDLLRQHVERPVGHDEAVKLPATDAVDKRRALHQIVARERKQAPLGRAADGVARAADALQEGRDRARRTDLTDEIDVADVDPELERSGRHESLEFAALQPLFGGEPELLGHAAVMRGDGLIAEPIGKLARDAFGHAPGVDEHERGAVLLDELSQARVDFPPHLVRHHRLERRPRNFEAQIALALMPRIDDRDFRGRRCRPPQRRRGNGRRLRSDSAWPRGRCAAGGRRTKPRASPATERDARRVCSARRRGFRRRSPTGRSTASRARTPSRAKRKAIPASSPGCAADGGASDRARRRACRPF